MLLVEDETPVRNVTLLLLEKLGYRVLEAANAEEAFSLVESGQAKIELLLTDVIMPGRSSREPGLKVLFQSGYTGEAVLRRANIKPDMVFLKKPFTLSHLAKKIREVLDL